VDPFPTKRFGKHGLNDLMHPNLDMHPYGPQIPGSSGLFFGIVEDSEEVDHTWRVISRLRPGRWQYQGQYKMALVPPLTPQEWFLQEWKVGRFHPIKVKACYP